MLRSHRSWLTLVIVSVFTVSRADLYVPADYSTIQAAINAASPGDTIHLAAGRYSETLAINKSLTLAGSSTNNCVLYCETNIPLITITGPATVTLSDFEINGGKYVSGFYNGASPLGITATNAGLVMNRMIMNQFYNFFVTARDGSIAMTNLFLWTRDILIQCDVGLQLDGCTGTVSRLVHDGKRIDHTININGLSGHRSDITVDQSVIRTSAGSYGNCIRTYVNSNVRIANCYLYRGADTVPAAPAFNHSGISVNGYSNTVVIIGNTISNVPWAMYLYGSPGLGGNLMMIESNTILNSPIGGIVWDGMNYKGVDLGGGAVGSRGGNVFSETPSAPATFICDVLFTNGSGFSSANIFALHNTWSNPTNKEAVIYDKLDNPNCGRLITDELQAKSLGADAAHRPVISWNERGAGEKYTIETSSNLPAAWATAPGSWPITNSGLNAMTWTNPVVVTSNVFFRVRSIVP